MTDDDKGFNTHIKEPRWQQIASIIIVLGLLGTWFWFTFH